MRLVSVCLHPRWKSHPRFCFLMVLMLKNLPDDFVTFSSPGRCPVSAYCFFLGLRTKKNCKDFQNVLIWIYHWCQKATCKAMVKDYHLERGLPVSVWIVRYIFSKSRGGQCLCPSKEKENFPCCSFILTIPRVPPCVDYYEFNLAALLLCVWFSVFFWGGGLLCQTLPWVLRLDF